MTFLVLNEREYEYIPGTPTVPPDLPILVPADKLGTGLHIKAGEQYIYVVHDDLTLGAPRTVVEDKIKGDITGELYVPRRWYFREDVNAWRVDQYSKITFWPEELEGGWYPYFFSGMSDRQHALFNESGFGWRDGATNLLVILWQFVKDLFAIPGLNPYHFLITSGSMLKKAGSWREWTLFACQDTDKPPAWETYTDNPAHVFKQGVCGDTQNGYFYGSINQHQGDLFIPTACPSGIAAIKTEETRPLPVCPCDLTVDGRPMRIVEMIARASEIFGLNEADGKWYYLLEQRYQNGNASDFVVHAAPWPAVLPVSMVNWRLS